MVGMGWLQNTYTRRYNVRHRAWGRVFGDRYKAAVVQGDAPFHYQTLIGEVDARCSHLRRGWYWGTQAFGEKLRKLADALLQNNALKSRSYRSNPHVAEHGEKQA